MIIKIPNQIISKTLTGILLFISVCFGTQIRAQVSDSTNKKLGGKLVITSELDSTVGKSKVKSEKKDTSLFKKKKYYNPGTATWMAVACPGLGQIYNRRYWKLPIVYAGLGVATYFLISNQHEFVLARDSYRSIYYTETQITPNPYTVDPKYAGFAGSQVKSYRDYYRRNRDISIVAMAAVYALQIVDAVVDAHLRSFDVSDDLSLKIKPATKLMPKENLYYSGISLAITIKK